MKKLLFVLLGLLAMTSCHDNEEEVRPATKEQLQELTGHWYAEIPFTGETLNWRTEEEDDKTTYDQIAAVIYLNGDDTNSCFWGYLYLQNGDMVNYDGLHHRNDDANFSITMDSEGNITTSSDLSDAPQVSNMHFDSTKDIITADIAFKCHNFNVTFIHLLTPSEQETLGAFYQILQEEGIIGGLTAGTGEKTDISDGNANEPSRAKRLIH